VNFVCNSDSFDRGNIITNRWTCQSWNTNKTYSRVDMWMNFLIHNHWIAYSRYSNNWTMTDKGKRWIDQISAVYEEW